MFTADQICTKVQVQIEDMNMNKISLPSTAFFSLFILVGSVATASVYTVDSMVCRGPRVDVDAANAPNLNPDIPFEIVQFTSFKSQKKNGDNVDTLGTAQDYAKTEAELPNSLDEQKVGLSYGGPLQVDGNHVTQPDHSSGDYDLTILKSETKDGERIDTLTGTDGKSAKNTTYGYYQLTCTAKVLDEPVKTIDATNVCRRLAGQAVIDQLKHERKTRDLTCTQKARADYADKKIHTFFVFARCDNGMGYSYTVDTTPKDQNDCDVDTITATGSRQAN